MIRWESSPIESSRWGDSPSAPPSPLKRRLRGESPSEVVGSLQILGKLARSATQVTDFSPMFRWKNTLLLIGAALALSGCSASTARQIPVVRGVAASFMAARAFDRAKSAIRRDDSAGLERAGRELRRAADAVSNPRLTSALVVDLWLEASSLATQSDQISGTEKIRLAESSNARYRAALAFAPLSKPEVTLDPVTLNALGYFLADKGSTKADFERAAVLTRAAYRTWDISGRATGATELARATGPQDSYAWALFKLGRLTEARTQAERVWDLARGMGADSTEMTADIPFHLGEIYRALGLEIKAREAYEAALGMTITDETRVLVEGGLKSLDLARV